jgi:periplasmic copper chaperone A
MFRVFALGALAATLSMPAIACEGIAIEDPYARSSMAMARSGAAFLRIVNAGPIDCHLIGVRSDAAERMELHTHTEDAQGVMRMIHVEEGFVIPAGGARMLARGGDHLMFMGLTRPFEQGAVLAVTFEFADGTELEAMIPVDLERQDSPAHAHGEGGHNHGHSHSHGHSHGD